MPPQVKRSMFLNLGLVGLVLSGAFFYFSLPRFESLPNYQRVALLIPVSASALLIYVDTFLSWSTASVTDRVRAIGAALATALLIAGSAAWWIIAPDTYG